MDQKAMDVIFILDRSGSMRGQESDVVGGFNAMVAQQREKGSRVRVTTVLFDHEAVCLHDRVPVEQVAELTEADYRVRGRTALLDAMGHTVTRHKGALALEQEQDRPAKTLAVVMTDGFENASRSYGPQQIRELVHKLEAEEGWEFLFIGADMDAIAAGAQVGVRASKSFRFDKGTDSFRGGLGAVGQVVDCLYSRDEPLTDEDWRILKQCFDQRKKKEN